MTLKIKHRGVSLSNALVNNYEIDDQTITFGIDQSYLNFAVVVFQGKRVIDRVVFHAGESTPANLKKKYDFFCGNIIDQLRYIQNKFDELVDQYDPKYLVFEGLSFGSVGNRVFQLGGLFFHVAVNYLNKFNLQSSDRIVTTSPTEAKKLARSYLPEEDQIFIDKKTNKPVLLKSKKYKLKNMQKTDMVQALKTTEAAWILDGYTASGTKIQSGSHDLPDAYFIGLSFINKYYISR